jgi:hypothetical protein
MGKQKHSLKKFFTAIPHLMQLPPPECASVDTHIYIYIYKPVNERKTIFTLSEQKVKRNTFVYWNYVVFIITTAHSKVN